MVTLNQPLVEELAAYAHNTWIHWMEYLFSQSIEYTDGSALIPKAQVERWQKQVATPYQDLSEKEKKSDRKQARIILSILRKREWTEDRHAPRGFYEKYQIEKTDGMPIAPDSRYFVLRLDNDKDARIAVRLWAMLKENEELLKDLSEENWGY